MRSEALLKEYPENIVIVNRYKRYCYEWITYRLMTRPKLDSATLQQAIDLQSIVVRLVPEDAGAEAKLAWLKKNKAQFIE